MSTLADGSCWRSVRRVFPCTSSSQAFLARVQPWITPSLFDGTNDNRIVDEWTFGQYQSYPTALSKLQNHWNTWITEQDFADIAAAGCAFPHHCCPTSSMLSTRVVDALLTL